MLSTEEQIKHFINKINAAGGALSYKINTLNFPDDYILLNANKEIYKTNATTLLKLLDHVNFDIWYWGATAEEAIKAEIRRIEYKPDLTLKPPDIRLPYTGPAPRVKRKTKRS